MSQSTPRHVLSMSLYTRQDLDALFSAADRFFQAMEGREQLDLLEGTLLASLFFQPSTRTRLGFEAAMCRLGGRTLNLGSGDASRSGNSGESFADTVRVMSGLADVLVIRHEEIGLPSRCARYATVPVINGGDGLGPRSEHPTQALIDLYAMKRFAGRIDGTSILMVGGLYHRTAHSLAIGLTRYQDVTLYVCGPEDTWWSDEEQQELISAGLAPVPVNRIEDAVAEVDFIYHNAFRKSPYGTVDAPYRTTARKLQHARPNLKVLHPLNRGHELDIDVDDTPHAGYFEQSRWGVAVRMAVLADIFGVSPFSS